MGSYGVVCMSNANAKDDAQTIKLGQSYRKLTCRLGWKEL